MINFTGEIDQMRRSGRIGIGWYEDYLSESKFDEDYSQFAIQELATSLLKDKLTEVFKIIQEKHYERNEER